MEPNETNTVPAIPSWQFASDDHSTRFVVVTDELADLAGWSIHYNHVDGTPDVSSFSRQEVWIDDAGVVDVREIGTSSRAWTATIEAAALLESFETPDGRVLRIDPWDGMIAWLVESMVDKPSGLIIDLGPNTYIPEEDAEDLEIVNAQIHVLDDGVYLIRRSRTLLQQLRLVDHGVDGLDLDRWHHDGLFDDCTDGYLFSRDRTLVASACASWFRDAGSVDALDELGCSYEFADELPRKG